ncbi:2-amino-3-ketobutyrate coenzyme A ligase [Dyadobacter sp. CECT 9275]|uniref:2-amino-3-ketobutyrate coenzyme A ligase n=1 Tax=Dyadobacter helix TaxID=2822344 RepID=A0A916NDS9_9BACT|nr:aminotransferase class I/II-fold pyridoxal phosphate-dependent enzyme [Dyadobacter sp. CECT 9275]CAG5009975.1 2-amino-3-ketobutyrate coenzyme A ligase [Dyadobacter sp. CECT 9275]
MIYPTNQLPGRKVIMTDGAEYLWFSGTDYLGMGHHQAYKEFLKQGFSRYGTHFGSSRNNSLRLEIYEETETLFAGYAGAPASLLVSSGMWAGQLVLKEIESIAGNSTADLAKERIRYHYAPGSHPAIWGNNFCSNNLAWQQWASRTIQEIRENPDHIHIVCSDAVGSPWVAKHDFSLFSDLPRSQNIWFVVDDSHGIGVTGDNGKGIYSPLDKLQQNSIVVASLNKGMGIPAGVILAAQDILDRLRQSPWFAGASPSVPAYIYAFRELLLANAYQECYEKMITNIRYFADALTSSGLFVGIADYAVMCSRNISLFDYLLTNGIFASCFSYPLPTDEPVTRLAISALHEKEDLDRLAEVCIHFES